MGRLYGRLLRLRGRGDMLRQRPTESQAKRVRYFEGWLSDLLPGQKWVQIVLRFSTDPKS